MTNTNTKEIEIRIKSIEQLFNSLDPAPFRERELDREAERHIVSYARGKLDESRSDDGATTMRVLRGDGTERDPIPDVPLTDVTVTKVLSEWATLDAKLTPEQPVDLVA